MLTTTQIGAALVSAGIIGLLAFVATGSQEFGIGYGAGCFCLILLWIFE